MTWTQIHHILAVLATIVAVVLGGLLYQHFVASPARCADYPCSGIVCSGPGACGYPCTCVGWRTGVGRCR